MLYLSDYLERHREGYYDRLSRTRSENDISGWLHFFLDGIPETTKHGVETFDRILKFQAHWEKEIHAWKPQGTVGLALFRYLFTHTWVNTQQVADAASISLPTASKLIERFLENKLLREITGAKRDRIFLFEPCLQLFR